MYIIMLLYQHYWKCYFLWRIILFSEFSAMCLAHRSVTCGNTVDMSFYIAFILISMLYIRLVSMLFVNQSWNCVFTVSSLKVLYFDITKTIIISQNVWNFHGHDTTHQLYSTKTQIVPWGKLLAPEPQKVLKPAKYNVFPFLQWCVCLFSNTSRMKKCIRKNKQKHENRSKT